MTKEEEYIKCGMCGNYLKIKDDKGYCQCGNLIYIKEFPTKTIYIEKPVEKIVYIEKPSIWNKIKKKLTGGE